MSEIPDFTETELQIISETLRERYGVPVDIQLADSDLRLNPHSTGMTSCPTVYWRDGKCHFVICKTSRQHYRCQFNYSVREEYGTGISEYGDILDCVVSLLRVQADHERERTSKAGAAKAPGT